MVQIFKLTTIHVANYNRLSQIQPLLFAYLLCHNEAACYFSFLLYFVSTLLQKMCIYCLFDYAEVILKSLTRQYIQGL